MEIIETKTNENGTFEENQVPNQENGKGGWDGRILAGLLLASYGGLFLMRELGVELPALLFSWPMILIGIGLYTGARHNFRLKYINSSAESDTTAIYRSEKNNHDSSRCAMNYS